MGSSSLVGEYPFGESHACEWLSKWGLSNWVWSGGVVSVLVGSASKHVLVIHASIRNGGDSHHAPRVLLYPANADKNCGAEGGRALRQARS